MAGSSELDRKYHDVSNIFPLLRGAEYDELKNDIARNGLLEAIWLHSDGSIIDGRNRHRACLETDTAPRFKTWSGKGSLVSFVVSLNLHRRHLTSSQCAVVALEILPMLEKEAQKRMSEHARENNETKQGTQAIAYPEKQTRNITGESREFAARITKTNRQYVSDAKKLQSEAPDLLAEVRTGAKTIPQAKRELTKRTKKKAPPLPSDKYRVLYADPPWSYGNKGLDDYGHAERHYPVMTISELSAMGPDIKALTDNSAVLFLWVTSPLLEECFPVIKAWGFKYKTSFVWNKVGHNFGHYNSVRHELLLICTRGSCTPDIKKLFDSVQEIPKSKKHSEKPERFREIIDTLYTHGKRLELFARTQAEGWEAWGNEPR